MTVEKMQTNVIYNIGIKGVKEEMEVKIKEVGRTVTYVTIKGKTKAECFDNIYAYFKSNQYCWQVERKIEDLEIAEEYRVWVKNQGDSLWWKHASGSDFD